MTDIAINVAEIKGLVLKSLGYDESTGSSLDVANMKIVYDYNKHYGREWVNTKSGGRRRSRRKKKRKSRRKKKRKSRRKRKRTRRRR